MKKLFIILFLTTLGFSSCKKDVSRAITVPTVDEQARDYLYDAMNEYYFWYNLMPVVVKTDYKDPYELLDAMEYKTLDRWSFVQTYAEYQAQNQGSFVGHGISLGLDQDSKVRIAQIYKNSPLYSNGVRRGWIVKNLNGTDLAPIFIARDNAAYSQVIGPSTAGVTNTFLFQIPDGRDSTITSTKTSFTLNTVIAYDTLHLKSGITGHLVFDQFIPPSNQELATAFAFFQQNSITDLIVDLRYNGGGDLSVLTNMASYLAGEAKFNTTFLKITFNDKNTIYNTPYNFNPIAYPLNLTKVVFICTRGTASASEDLINGLKPDLTVTCIGDTTNGKPVGMIGIPYKTDYMFWPISFAVVNSADQGDFYKGFAPDKYVPDDITHDWSDRNELCLSEAIYFLEHGNFTSKGIYGYQRSIQFSEKPEKNNNAYIIKK
ncbi:MAG: S41 family peptidase [Bacteroidales bacterium]